MYNDGLQKDPEKGLTPVNRNVEDLRMSRWLLYIRPQRGRTV